MIIYSVINVFIPNAVSIHLHIWDHSIVAVGKRGLGLGFSNTSHVDSLNRFRKLVTRKVHNAIDNLKVKNSLQEDKNKWKYANEFINNMGFGDPTIFDYVFIGLILVNNTVLTHRL